MKAKSILAALLLLVAGLQTAWAQKVLLYKTNSQMVEYEVSELDSIVFVEAEAKLVQQIVLSVTSLSLQPNDMRFLTATVLPENAQNKVVTWQSSDTNVAEVNQSGRVIANANGTCVITCRATDGSGVMAECQCQVKEKQPDTMEYVDLGLPSGTLWATCNVGASKPEEYGDYFAWGETKPKSTYDWSTYKWCQGDEYTMTKYCTDGDYGFTDNLKELQPADDAATANWGSAWQMPSVNQIDELINSSYTTTEWTQVNGVNGRKITSKINGNSIFLPAAGYRRVTSLSGAGDYGHYWSRLLRDGSVRYACYLSIYSDNISRFNSKRDEGQSVRPVRVSAQLVTSITLSQTSLSLEPGKTQTLTATVLPSNANNKAVTWTSSNTGVATVSTSGMVTAVSNGTCVITCRATDGSGVMAECLVTVGSSGQEDDHDYVDLGLPSGTLWATCNVGASKPEDYGDYFAWGETAPKSEYNWSTYFDSEGVASNFKKYNRAGGLKVLAPEDDAATANWGSGWQMPSAAQQHELVNSSYTTTEWTTVNGVDGIKITSKSNGNSIFLPAAAISGGTTGNGGYYWSRSLDTSDNSLAYYLLFSSGSISSFSYRYRCHGLSVRPVQQPVQGITISPATITLKLGKTKTLTANILPSDATNNQVTWSSSNTSIATVNTNGMVTAIGKGTCIVTATSTDVSGVKGTCQVTVNDTGIGSIAGHEYVEIGGLRWATMNVGATTVAGSYATCYGDYYAWGETQPRYMTITRSGNNSASFTWRSGFSSGYSDDNWPTYTGSTLDASHDAATTNWGSTWRTPTNAEFDALAIACSGSSSNGQKPVNLTSSITTGGIYWLSRTQTYEPAYTGVDGLLFVSKSDISKRVFFPASGFVLDTSLSGMGAYWSSSLHTSSTDLAYDLGFGSTMLGLNVGPSYFNCRYYGLTVRPVSDY